MLENLRKSFLAGMMISIGAAVYLSCESKVAGALFFTVGLVTICVLGLFLYTGKIGYALENKNKPNVLLIWLGNLLGTAVCGVMMRFALPQLHDKARPLFENKMAQNPLATVVLGLFCGVLMYIAVEHYKEGSGAGRFLGIILCVPTFILCGFEHSIADMVYCTFAVDSWADIICALIFVIIVTVGNTLGSLIFRILSREVR